MRQKRLLLLGGLSYLLPIIDEAHKLGAYVITADYLPDNIAHKHSDEYCNVSIVDREAVLKIAESLKIDGILSHAVDPGVISAAYVAEKLHLPYQCSYETACILQDKARFRRFLIDNEFNCPKAKGYDNIQNALKDVECFEWPVIVKPVDSAGSKGVTKVNNPIDLNDAVLHALNNSPSGKFIIEDFLEKEGFSIGSESFVVDGKLLYNGIYDQYFDPDSVNPFTPSAEVWPSVMNSDYQEEFKNELQRLMTLLGVTTGLFNVEARVCKNGKLYLMEVSPRAGGNRLAEMLNYAADININEAETRKALGLPIGIMREPKYNGHFAVLVLHSYKNGIFDSIDINEAFKANHVIETELRVSPGEKIAKFTGANAAIGTLFLRFESREELTHFLSVQDSWMKINVR